MVIRENYDIYYETRKAPTFNLIASEVASIDRRSSREVLLHILNTDLHFSWIMRYDEELNMTGTIFLLFLNLKLTFKNGSKPMPLVNIAHFRSNPGRLEGRKGFSLV